MPPALTIPDAVLSWGADARRQLPWRETRDGWAVLVSELMLQQTQVSRVRPKWERFLARFPTPAACAAAPAGEVIRLWAGLGYNRRALYLHRCAQELVRRHAGGLPDELGALLALPGIGPYTARAVLAFAFERDVGVLDTNAARVLARAVARRRLRAAEAQALADRLVPAGQGWSWNQAMLDLGATVCTARAPACAACPLGGAAPLCSWAAAGCPPPDPMIGSAHTSAGTARQGAFDGSDRQGRGRLVAALRVGPVVDVEVDLATACGWPDEPARARRVAEGLLAEGLAVRVDTNAGPALALPGFSPSSR